MADDALLAELAAYPSRYEVRTRADDLAVFQYTSGTTRELPAAVRHTHRAIVVLMIAALYGTGIRPGDRFFCPSSPAWGHGLWHGTLAPLALGVTTGTMAGKFEPVRLLRALQDYEITIALGRGDPLPHDEELRRSGPRIATPSASSRSPASPSTRATRAFVEDDVPRPRVQHVRHDRGRRHPRRLSRGAADYVVKPGALGKPVPGVRVEVQRPDGKRCAPDEMGEIVVWRRGAWFPTKDRGWVDAEGYFYHAGRADDVIISAGWTMSAVEIEDVLLKHPDVREAAVIGVADALRGLVVKAFIVSARPADEAFARELQEFTRTRLSQHEYPRHVAFVAELPKTPAGKVNRKALRDAETGARRRAHACLGERPCAARDGQRCSPRSPTTASTTCAGASASRSPTRSSPGATRPRATASATTRTASATTIRCGAIRTTRPHALRHHHRAAQLPLRHEPHHLGLRRRPARRARHVGRAPTGPGTCPCAATTTITTEAWLKDLVEHQTALRGPRHPADLSRRLLQPARRARRRGRTAGASAPTATWRASRAPSTPRSRRRPPKRYTDEELAEVYQLYANEEIRGAVPRYWQDVAEGERLPTMAKGPMTVTGFIAFAQGWGGLYIRANKLAWKQIHRHSGLGIKNRFGIPDCPERVHWETEFATHGGRARRLRLRARALLVADPPPHELDGRRRVPPPGQHCKIRRHNPEGDVLRIDGTVVRKLVEGGRHLVEIEQEARNQDGEQSVIGRAVVELPARA